MSKYNPEAMLIHTYKVLKHVFKWKKRKKISHAWLILHAKEELFSSSAISHFFFFASQFFVLVSNVNLIEFNALLAT